MQPANATTHLPAKANTPTPLHQGDEVAFFSPSSYPPGQHPAMPEGVLATMQTWGLRVRRPKPPRRHLYLAGEDAWRAQEFADYYRDPNIKAMFATRGGYGAARMLPLLPVEDLAATPPKAVVGMSDVTALFCWLGSQLGVGGLHGPCVCSPSGLKSLQQQQDLESLHARLFFPQQQQTLPAKVLHWPKQAHFDKRASASPSKPLQGTLQGGCLTVLASLAGSPWALRGGGGVLLLEDVGERPYRLDRCIAQLRQSGAFEGVQAVVLGWFSGCDEAHTPGLLQTMWQDVFANAPFAVVQQVAFGHGSPNHTMPLGKLASLYLPAQPTPQADCTLVV